MEIVRQTTNKTCVACVLAMMIGESEKYVMDWFEHVEPPYTDSDAFIFLAHHGIYNTFSLSFTGDPEKGDNIQKDIPINFNIPMLEFRAYLVVESQTFPGRSHAVFWDGKNVLDPQKDTPQELDDYKVIFVYPFSNTEERAIKKKIE